MKIKLGSVFKYSMGNMGGIKYTSSLSSASISREDREDFQAAKFLNNIDSGYQ